MLGVILSKPAVSFLYIDVHVLMKLKLLVRYMFSVISYSIFIKDFFSYYLRNLIVIFVTLGFNFKDFHARKLFYFS